MNKILNLACGGMTIVFAITFAAGYAHAAQEENFVDEVVGADVVNTDNEQQSIDNNSTVSQSATAAAAGATIVVAQNSGEEVEEVLSEEEEEEVPEAEYTIIDQYSLPRSSAPVAVDSTIQTSAPLGSNSQDALSRPPGVKKDSSYGFFPTLSIGISTQHNPAREPGGENETDTVISIIPGVAYRGAIRNRHPYELYAQAAHNSFDEFANLDSESIVIGGALNLDITRMVQADLFAEHIESNDPRGATATRILDAESENDDYERDRYGARVTIGRRSNTLQLVLGADQDDIDFTNNNQDNRDREDTSVEAGLYWNTGPRTSLFARIRKRDIDYVLASQNGFDSDETYTTVGIGWEPSFNTSIIFEIGNEEKDLADPNLQDYDDTTYTGRVNWRATNNTRLGFYTTLRTEESTDFNSPYIETELYGIDLWHSFTDRIRGQAFYNHIDDDLVNVRQDEIEDYGVGLFYDVTRWLTVGANWQKTVRESTDPAAEYDTDSWNFTASLSGNKTRNFGKLQTDVDARASSTIGN